MIFFANDCIAYNDELLGRTYCFTLDDHSAQIVCAFTVSNDSIKAKLLPKPSKNRVNRNVNNQKRGLKSYPAVLIGRLGVAKSYENRGIGKELMDFIQAWFIDGANKTGCRFVVVDAYNRSKVLSYYEKNGYKPLFNSEEEEKEYSAIQSGDQLEPDYYFLT
ncbi:MAG: GNAT family N-acetyltransferase, partial [Marinoscillum sp.]